MYLRDRLMSLTGTKRMAETTREEEEGKKVTHRCRV